MKNIKKKEDIKALNETLSRKEWVIKAGKYSIFTATTMMTILNPGKAQAEGSGATLPGDDSGWN